MQVRKETPSFENILLKRRENDISASGNIKQRAMAEYNKRTGKFVSYILRHHPERIGITLDEHGWADVQELIDGVNSQDRHELTKEILDALVASPDKARYSYNEDQTKIRANHGHSVRVDVELQPQTPPDILYHGTGEKYVAAIDEIGLIGKSRLYVHLSETTEVATGVGGRHGKPVVYRVRAGEMAKDGYVFFKSLSGIWLTERVPAQYLEKTED